MPHFPTSANLINWVCSSVSGAVGQRQRTVIQLMLGLAIAFAFITMIGLLGLSPIAEAANCGAINQRPCNIFERIPSCNNGLYEDFKKGRCLAKAVPGRDCGRANQRPCKIWERIPSCNKGLVEDFKKGQCVTKAVPGRDCGRANQRPCLVWERIPSCNKGLVEHLPSNRCTTLADLGNKFKCGKRNQKPCTVLERIPSCDNGLVEHLPSNQCTTLADLGNKFKCGKRYQKPCKILERIPSCDSGLVEDIFKGKCIPSADAERHRIAEEKLKQIGGFVVSKVPFATKVSNNPQVRKRLNSQDKTSVARVVNKSGVGEKQMPDGHLLRTLTVGATVGGKVIFVGTSGGAGAAIDLKGQRPAYAYATGDYSFGPGLAAGGGIDVGFWVCQNNKIGGDSWGVEFGVDDLALALAKKVNLKKGPSLGIGLWFNYNNVFQGFTITPGFGIGADFGGVVKAGTAVEDDPSVECDGRPKPGSKRRFKGAIQAPTPTPDFKGHLKRPNPNPSLNPSPKTLIQEINYGGGIIRQHKVSKKAPRPGLVKICLKNLTGQPKAITHGVSGIKPLKASKKGSRSCANFSAKLRLHFSFVDRGRIKKRDVMSLSQYAGDIVVFKWLRDQ